MNKKSLSYLRKGFKLESPLITIGNISTTYIKKETGEILASQLPAYPILNNDVQELYLKNVKKLMSGQINVNVFNLDFNEAADDNKTLFLEIARNSDNFTENCNTLLSNIIAHYNYNTDIVVNIIQFVLNKEEVNYYYMACSISKIKNTSRDFICDLIEGEFSTSYQMNPVIAITTPTDGFIYPSIDEEVPDIDHIINYTSSKNNLNTEFVSEVITAIPILSVQQERDLFLNVIQDIFNGQISCTKLNSIYTKIKEREDFGSTITIDRLKHIIIEQDNSIEEKVNTVFEEKVPLGYEFTIVNIIPDFKNKSLLLNNEQLDIKMNPECLENLEYIIEDNKTYLKVRIKDTLKSYGMDLMAEHE